MKRDIRQHDITDCAAAAVCSIARHYGHDIPLTLIREASGTSASGTTLKGIMDACARTGFTAAAYCSRERDIEALRGVALPAILHTVNSRNELHFVVLYRLDRKRATIMDPAVGKHIRRDIEALQREWTGYLVTMYPACGKNSNICRKDRSAVNYISLLLWTKRDFLLSLLGSMVYVTAGVCSTLFLQHIIDVVIPSGDGGRLMRTGALLAALTILTPCIGYCRSLFSLRNCVRLDGRLIIDYLRHLFSLPADFFSRRGSGELHARIPDAMKVRLLLTEGAETIISGGAMLTVALTLMFAIHPPLAIMTAASIPLYCILYGTSRVLNRRVNRRIMESAAAFEEKSVSCISTIRLMRYFGCTASGCREVERSYAGMSAEMYAGGRLQARFAAASDLLTRILVCLVITFGARFIIAGSLTVGELVSFYAMCSLFSAPLGRLASIADMVSDANVALERIEDITLLEGEARGGLAALPEPGADLILQRATFAYPGHLPVFENLDYTFKGGKITAVRGESGCGKSSIASLLMRDYRLNSGKILLGGEDISLFDIEEWRRYISIVPQEAVLLNATILDNITGGGAEPDLKRAAALLDELGMKPFISALPEGILTRIGERGCCLSGGQRQRIALARALYRDPQILILDECTSSLDQSSQEFILNRIKALRDSGKSVIMITHRDDNAAIADEIFEMRAHASGQIPAAPEKAGENN